MLMPKTLKEPCFYSLPSCFSGIVGAASSLAVGAGAASGFTCGAASISWLHAALRISCTVHNLLIFLSFLIVVLYIRIILEIVGSLAHDILNPRRKHRILVAHGNEEEDARSQHIVEVVGNEGSDQLVLLLREADRLLVQLLVDSPISLPFMIAWSCLCTSSRN